MAPRGRGGKFGKPSRGGGKHYSRDVEPVDKDGNVIGMWRDPDDGIKTSSEEEDSGSASENESSGDELAKPHPSSSMQEPMTREQRRAAAKARREAAIAKKSGALGGRTTNSPSDSDADAEESHDSPGASASSAKNNQGIANPNHTAKSRLLASGAAKGNKGESEDEQVPMSRREREALQAQKAREHYMKLHAEGKTEEARADLARLALVRERREAEKAKKEAEAEAKAEQERQRAELMKEREEKLRKAAAGGGTARRRAKK